MFHSDRYCVIFGLYCLSTTFLAFTLAVKFVPLRTRLVSLGAIPILPPFHRTVSRDLITIKYFCDSNPPYLNISKNFFHKKVHCNLLQCEILELTVENSIRNHTLKLYSKIKFCLFYAAFSFKGA